MSDILIKGMEMPTNCCQCPVNMEICKRGYKYLLEHPELYDKRADDCPLVPVPPHGRLIDAADAVETAWMILRGLGYRKEENPQLEQTVHEVFATAPTIEVK